MSTLTKILLFFLQTLPLLTYGQDSIKTHYTLEQCIDLALKNNANVLKSASGTEQAQLNVKQARANLLPSLNGSLSHGINTGLVTNPITNANERANIASGSQSLSASMVLFNGLNRLRNIRQQAFALKAYQMDEQRVKDNITLDVILAYMQVIMAQDVLEQNKQQRDVTQKQLNRLALLNKDGAVSPDEYYDMQGALSGDEINVLNATNTLKNNIINLVSLLNIPYSETLAFESIQQPIRLLPDSIHNETLYQHAAAHLGVLKSAEYFKKSAEYGLKANRSLYLPSLSLGGSINSAYSNTSSGTYYDQIRENYGKGIGFTLSIPILNDFSKRIQVARAKIDLRNAEIDLESTKNALQQETAAVLFNLKTAQEKYKEQKQQVIAYKESFRIAEVKFEAGAINSVDFLLQKNKYDQANINLVVAQYEWQLRQRIARYYNGER